jgi:hypothetical protein
VARLLAVYGEVFALIRDVLDAKNLRERLKAEPLVPLFRIR